MFNALGSQLAQPATTFGPNLYLRPIAGTNLPAFAQSALTANAATTTPATRVVIDTQHWDAQPSLASASAQLNQLAQRFATHVDVKTAGDVQEFIPAAQRAKIAETGVMMAAGTTETDAAEKIAKLKAQFAAVSEDDALNIIKTTLESGDTVLARTILDGMYARGLVTYSFSDLTGYSLTELMGDKPLNPMRNAILKATMEMMQEPGAVQDLKLLTLMASILNDKRDPMKHDDINMEAGLKAMRLIYKAIEDGTFDPTDTDESIPALLEGIYRSLEFFSAHGGYWGVEGIQLILRHLRKPGLQPVISLSLEKGLPYACIHMMANFEL